MPDHNSRTFTEYLRRIDNRLFLEADADSRNRSKRAYWIKYQLSGHLPLKLAAISELDEFAGGPGDWLLLLLHRLNWRWLVESAKVSFSRQYDERHALGISSAQRVPFA
jgi:hypothetical protein